MAYGLQWIGTEHIWIDSSTIVRQRKEKHQMTETPLSPAIAQWLAGLIDEAITNLAYNPGLTIETEGDNNRWAQLIPEVDPEDQSLSGIILNFAYQKHKGDPLETIKSSGLRPPPGSETLEWEDDGFARIWMRPDVPLIALSMFIGDILAKIEGAPEGFKITVKVEYGY